MSSCVSVGCCGRRAAGGEVRTQLCPLLRAQRCQLCPVQFYHLKATFRHSFKFIDPNCIPGHHCAANRAARVGRCVPTFFREALTRHAKLETQCDSSKKIMITFLFFVTVLSRVNLPPRIRKTDGLAASFNIHYMTDSLLGRDVQLP